MNKLFIKYDINHKYNFLKLVNIHKSKKAGLIN